MIRSLSTRGDLVCKCSTGSNNSLAEEPSTPTKKKTTYLWRSLHSRRLLLLLSRIQRLGDGDWRTGIHGGGTLRNPLHGAMEYVGLGQLKNVKSTVLILLSLNVAVLVLAILLAVSTSLAECSRNIVLGAALVAGAAGMRLIWMLGMAIAQAGCASTMMAIEGGAASPRRSGDMIRRQRRIWYKRWLWSSRVGIIITVLQAFGTLYFSWFLGRNGTVRDGHLIFCHRDEVHMEHKWLGGLMVSLPIAGAVILLAQCCVGSDVLAWRLLYGTRNEAWTAHYRQMFDYGIRELLCCLGRRRYMDVQVQDEVESVSSLIGDLVAYRAAGASHLEFIAGISLLREGSERIPADQDFEPAPNDLLAEAAVLHPYAEAAYTGPLLDVGRNPLTFPFVWLYRQGVLTPWTRHRRPALEGDNWWRGHAAAFLKRAQLPSEALRQGRVLQTNREAAYFVVVLQQLRYVLVAVRGTESPEDLLTDGLGTESPLTKSDLSGILENSYISDRVRQEILVTMPHFGHVGVIEGARELAMRLDHLAEGTEIAEHSVSTDDQRSRASGYRASLLPDKTGLLSSLLGPGGECEGYGLRFVGHSLGGAIATLTALRLASRFPDVHVYSFGTLPCVDIVTAEACAPFTTSLVYNDEFSSRLSVAAIMRLRAAALDALAADSNTDAALVTRLTRRLFKSASSPTGLEAERRSGGPSQRPGRRYSDALKGTEIVDEEAAVGLISSEIESAGEEEREEYTIEDTGPTFELLENGMPKGMSSNSAGVDVQELWPAEMFIPGLVIHIVRTRGDSRWFTMPKTLTFSKELTSRHQPRHRAVLKDRRHFKDILVSPSMFLDHMPWKCQYALNDILGDIKAVEEGQGDSTAESTSIADV